MSRASDLLEQFEQVVNKSTRSKQTFTVEFANEHTRNAFNRLLAMVGYLGSAGSSRDIQHAVDGDGSYRATIKGIDQRATDWVKTVNTDDDKIRVPGSE